MKYYNSKIIKALDFLTAKNKLIESLKEEGFGILTEIDLKEIMKKKLDKDYLPHTILGACNPVFADKSLFIDPHISAMLPCNATVRQMENGDFEVASINPEVAMGMIGDSALTAIAAEVQKKLSKAIERL